MKNQTRRQLTTKTTAQKLISTITIVIYSVFVLWLTNEYMSTGNVCQSYDRGFQHCLEYLHPQLKYFFLVLLIGTIVVFLIATPIYLIWGEKKKKI